MIGKLAVTSLMLVALSTHAAAESARIIVINGDPAGVGFNDPRPAAPVGGNPGTTRGQQALNVLQMAANRWAANLQSTKLIAVVASFRPLTCTAASAVLGGAAPTFVVRDVPPTPQGVPLEPGTFYPIALAEKLTRQEISEAVSPGAPFDIVTVFNSRLGQPDCLAGSGWYFGLDNRQPETQIDLLAVVMHEFGHGLGVTVSPTSANTGARAGNGPFPSVWERRMLDLSTGKRWIDMTAAERFASARNTHKLVWAGQKVTNTIPAVLSPALVISGAFPPEDVQPASFGPTVGSFAGTVVAPTDGAGSTLACSPFGADANTAGNIVLVDRGSCTFVTKVKHAQNAGATAVLVANNVSGLPGMGGTDPTVTIPSWGISQALGATLRAATPTEVRLGTNPRVRSGTTAGFARLFAPSSFQPGSSVSHFDTTLTPSVLMEPSITSDLTTRVKNPFDLTLALLRDIGW